MESYAGSLKMRTSESPTAKKRCAQMSRRLLQDPNVQFYSSTNFDLEGLFCQHVIQFDNQFVGILQIRQKICFDPG